MLRISRRSFTRRKSRRGAGRPKTPHGSNWLVSPEDASTAVCLRTGTEVELLYIPEDTQRRFGLPAGDQRPHSKRTIGGGATCLCSTTDEKCC